ncbi:MAG: NAD(P)H-hydrate epimerase, partial [Gemmatimonadota bacterium]|nr:NAD(P)H-hydrate epimerase [Gemmatimonadota bacterium]
MIAHPGPRWCLIPESIAAVDRAAIDAGLPGAALMESAGRGAAEAILEAWPAPGRASVWIGGGNNGGDGLVVARYLTAAGWSVEIVAFVDPDDLEGDAGLQWALLEPLDLEVERIEG